VSDHVSHPYNTTGKIVLIFIFLGRKPEDIGSTPNDGMYSALNFFLNTIVIF
jgi:hypothetical protein